MVAGSVVRGITKDCASSADYIVPVVLGDDATAVLESKQVSATFLRRFGYVCQGGDRRIANVAGASCANRV